MDKKITNKEILTKKFYDYYSDGKFELYDIQKFYYPYFKITCSCVLKEKTPLSKIDEVFLKAIKCGIKSFETLNTFLAIDKEIFDDIAGKLKIDDLYIETPILTLTPKGEKILEENGKIESFEDERFIVLDAINGCIINIDMGNEKAKDTSSDKNNLLSTQIPYPKNETLDKIVSQNKTLQTILFESIKNIVEKQNGDKKLYEIKEISENPYKFYKAYHALFFKNEETEEKVLIIQDSSPDDDMTNQINKLQEDGKILFRFSKEIEEKHKENFSNQIIYDYSDIDKLKTGTVLTTYQHSKFFDFLFKYTKKEIIIVSPWIRWEVIEEKQNDIEEALKRGVKINFFYGMGSNKDLDKESKGFFIAMQTKYPNLLKYGTNNTKDHSKIIMCDREWMISGSFNWTSFKGDPNRGKRGETGTFNKDIEEINKIVKRYVS